VDPSADVEVTTYDITAQCIVSGCLGSVWVKVNEQQLDVVDTLSRGQLLSALEIQLGM
jgi:hypothetical protein